MFIDVLNIVSYYFSMQKKYIDIWEKELMPFLFFALMRGTKDK